MLYKTGEYLLYKEYMNLRKTPKANGELLGVIPRGAVIDVTDVCDNWGKISFNGIEGWCCISECFAEKVTTEGCEACSYYRAYKALLEQHEELKESIKALLR